ncbi:MAG: ribonuclease P protein component [Phycisphaerae bacterium]
MNGAADSRSSVRATLPRAVRLRRKREFDAVFHAKVRVSDAVLTLWARSNDRDVARCGIAVSRRHGDAVVRNRFKRRIRAAFRAVRAELPIGLDLVVRPALGPPATVRAYEGALRALAQRVVKRLRGRRDGC